MFFPTFIALVLVSCPLSIGQTLRHKTFYTIPEHALVGSVIATYQVPDEFACCHKCVQNTRCLSFNYGIIFLQNALFMHDYHTDALPSVFQGFFKPIHNIHRYNTRLASKDTYYTFKIRTNYGKFNIRFSGAKVWNSIQENLKSEKRNQFKKILKKNILSTYPDA